MTYYDDKLQQGLEYQDFITKYFGLYSYSSKLWQNEVGENTIGMEIKFDNKFMNTGNIYIETHEKTNADNKEYIESGCLRKNSWLYLIGNYDVAFIFATKQLKAIYLKRSPNIVTTPTSKGFLLNTEESNNYSIHKIDFSEIENYTRLLGFKYK